jgi:hypothetical protein
MTKVELNPNQYGFAERGEKPAKPQPFGGKGDHDGDGKPGGAKKPVDKPDSRAKK